MQSEAKTQVAGRPVGLVVCASGLLVVLLSVWVAGRVEAWSEQGLRQLWHASGWVLYAAFTLGAALSFLRLRKEAAAAETEAMTRPSAAGSFLFALTLLATYFSHTTLRFPQGGMEILLALLVAAVLIGLLGRWIACAAAAERWGTRSLWLQWTATYALIALGLVHGILSHGHGYLAEQMGMKP